MVSGPTYTGTAEFGSRFVEASSTSDIERQRRAAKSSAVKAVRWTL